MNRKQAPSRASREVVPGNAIIVGGSLAGLMHGIMLRNAGWTVHILERSPTAIPASHMAGVCLASDVLSFLQRFDRLHHMLEIGISAHCLQTLRANGRPFVFQRVARHMTSWDALYHRLRANFDGLESVYTLREAGKEHIALSADEKSRAIYKHAMNVVEVEILPTGTGVDAEGSKVHVHAVNVQTAAKHDLYADVVIGADGPSSIVRSTFLPNIKRHYTGYLAWRGVVAEKLVSEQTRSAFSKNITYSSINGGHVIVYNIPGDQGSVREGERVLNFCWYSNTSESELGSVMTDVNGHLHRTNVPPELVRPEVWEERRKIAIASFLPPYLDILEHIESPFVHKVCDYWAPQVSFHDGRVLLVGDACTLLRPHIAFSTGQAAFGCQLVEELLVKSTIDAKGFNWQITKFTATHLARSVWFGDWFQKPIYLSLGSALTAWCLQFAARLRYWLGRSPAPRA